MNSVEMVHVAVTCEDGTVALVGIVSDDGRTICREITADYVEALIAQHALSRVEHGREYRGWVSPPKADAGGFGFAWRPIELTPELAALFEDEGYRDALEDRGTVITHNAARLRDRAVSRIRNRRDAEFARLDGEWMRALGRGDTNAQSDVERRRQEQRDRPQRVQAAIARVASLAELTAALASLGEEP